MKSANCESVCVYSPRPDWQIDFRCTNAQVSWSVVSESGEHILEAFTNYVWPNFDHLHGIAYTFLPLVDNCGRIPLPFRCHIDATRW